MHDTKGLNPHERGFAGLFADLVQELQRGESVDLEDVAREHPEFAENLRQLQPTFDLLAGKESSSEAGRHAQHHARVLGDYRLRREIGRGGMGIVYEAIQLSLDKRVALKILPFAGVLDERSLRRFRNEARAAAQLQHPHIVQVHHMGCDRGIHYYVMQFVEGFNLAQVIRGMRHLPVDARVVNDDFEASESTSPTASLKSGTDDSDETLDFAPSRMPRSGATVDSHETGNLLEAMSTKRSSSGPQFFFACARLGVDVAEALQHAHDGGVIHRDVKPSNLLIDRQGKVWVTDFGLAQIAGDPGVTATGTAVGTLRYMSPEQALAKRVVIDHRTDVYSLGATLYELLTLKHVFDGEDRQEILRKIAFSEPIPPRKINPRVPRELETIVLKSLAKNPDERYQTAWEMAQDLQSFRQDLPIRARRPTLVQRTGKWVRRHRTFAWFAALLAVVVLVGSTTSAAIIWNALGETQNALASVKAARTQLAEQLQRSEGLRLVGHSSLVRDENPGLALALAIAGAERRPGFVANQALLASLDALHEVHTLTGHTAPLGQAHFSPNGRDAVTSAKLAVAGAAAEPARIWNTVSGKLLRTLDDGTRITSAVYSPDEGRVLTAASTIVPSAEKQGSVKIVGTPPCLWDAVTGKKLLTLASAVLEQAHPAVFDPQGRRLVTPSSGNTARIWDAIGGHEIHALEGHTAPVRFAAFDPTGRRVATVSEDQTVRVWNAADGELLRTLAWQEAGSPDPSWECTVAFSPDGQELLTATQRHGVMYWDLESGERLNKAVWPGSLARFSPSGHRIYTYARFGALLVRDAREGTTLFTLGADTGLTWVDLSKDGRFVATCADNRDIRVWDALTGELRAVLRGHEGHVNQAVFSPDGLRLISAADDGTARIWNIESGAERAHVAAAIANVTSPKTTFSPDSRRLLATTVPSSGTTVVNVQTGDRSASFPGRPSVPGDSQTLQLTVAGKRIELWSLQSHELIASFTIPTDEFRFARLSHDGAQVVAATRHGAAWIWTPQTDRKVELIGHLGAVLSANFHPSGQTVATACEDGYVRLFDTSTGERLAELQHEGSVQDALFDPSGNKLLAVTGLGLTYVWDYEDRRQITVIRTPDHSMLAARFDASGERVLTFDIFSTATIACWDAESGQLLKELKTVRGMVRIALPREGAEALLGSMQDGAVLWNYETGESRTLTDQPVSAVAFRGDGQQMAIGLAITRGAPQFAPLEGPPIAFGGAEVQLWNRTEPAATKTLRMDSGEIRSVGFASDGSELVLETVSYGGTIVDVAEGTPPISFTGHAAPISHAVFSPDGAWVVTASWDDRAAIWDATSGRQLHQLQGHTAALTHCAISSDGKLLATASADGTCRIWDLATGALVETLTGHTNQLWHVAFSKDARRVLTISRDRTVRIWDRATKQHASLQEHRGLIAFAEFASADQGLLTVPNDEFRPVRLEVPHGMPAFLLERVRPSDEETTAAAYDVKLFRQIGSPPLALPHRQPPKLGRLSPTGDHVLTVTDTGEALLWDARSGEKLRTLAVADAPVEFAAFSPNGRRVLTSHGPQIILWSVATGERILAISDSAGFSFGTSWTLEQPYAPFSPDGQWLVTVSRTGKVRRWPLNPLASARAAAPRALTPEETASFEIIVP